MALPQSSVIQSEILQLSQEKFRWKTVGNLDRLAALFDDDLVFIHINGNITSKKQWIEELRSGRFVYNSIHLKMAEAKAYGDTAVLVGKATFNVTFHGSKGTFELIYTEVYTRKNGVWKLVNLHTTAAY